MIDKTELKKLIPTGDYCYSYTGRMVITNKYKNSNGDIYIGESYFVTPETKPCPFWKCVGDGDAFCAFLEETSEYGDTNLLWDQIKICNENPSTDETYTDDPEEYAIAMEKKSKARELRTPEFIQTLVDALSQSKNNSFTYDQVTYTLAVHIFDQFNPKN